VVVVFNAFCESEGNLCIRLATHGRTLLFRPYTEKAPHIENEWSYIDREEANKEMAQSVM
jgi:hypothetical protein